MTNLIFTIIAYLLESLAITFVVYILAKKTLSFDHLSWLFVSIASTLFLLDLFSPQIGLSARQGQGFVSGMSLMGGSPSAEGFSSDRTLENIEPYSKDILSTY